MTAVVAPEKATTNNNNDDTPPSLPMSSSPSASSTQQVVNPNEQKTTMKATEEVEIHSSDDEDEKDLKQEEEEYKQHRTKKKTSSNDNKVALKVLFLSSDTGGGHRASAESLAKQFELLFPGSTYRLMDLATETYLPPYNNIVQQYKHLSAHPNQWKILYGATNSKMTAKGLDLQVKVMSLFCERAVRRKIKSYHPDVVISVHPLQTNVPILSCAKISHETGKHLPMFTVVTDLGSAHSLWFANGIEKMFVGSNQIYELAKQRGKVPTEKLIQLGLPIRHDFAVESDRLGDRRSPSGKNYQREVRAKLQLPATDRKTLLVMGGGEGVGSLSNIVDSLYCEFLKQRIDAVICVVCGRNEKLKMELETKDWDALYQERVSHDGDDGDDSSNNNNVVTTTKRKGLRFLSGGSLFSAGLSGCLDSDLTTTGCLEAPIGVRKSLRRILSSGYLNTESAMFIPDNAPPPSSSSMSPLNPLPSVASSGGNDDDDENNPKSLEQRHKAMSIGAIPQHLSDDLTDKDGGEGIEALPPSSMTTTATNLPSVISDGDKLDKLYDEYTNDVIGEVTQMALNDTVDKHPVGPTRKGKVDVVGLGFVTNMAEYMVAADVLVSKAGPGTISEAAALSLPVMLTSFLPGQEEGNVDYVVDGGFGTFCEDTDPQAIAEELCRWLTNSSKMKQMSEAAKKFGAPHAARDIVQMIGDSTLKWREHNEGITVTPHSTNEEEEKIAAEEISQSNTM